MKQKKVNFTVNGEGYELSIEPWKTLLDVLRGELELTGTKKGCGTGNCGACTVLLNGKPVNSCLVLAVDANNKDILTIEEISRGEELHPIQEAFLEHGAVQCGYCSPGLILSAKALLNRNPLPSEMEVRKAISGHLCRCTGYVKIVKAICSVNIRHNQRV